MTDQAAAIQLAIAYLEMRGYCVSTQHPMVTPTELAKLAGCDLSPNAIWRRLHHKDCPPYEARYGPNGRIVDIRPNPTILAWLAKPKTPGLRLVA